jgi:hypothetical protein
MKNRSGSLKKEGATAGFERVFQKNYGCIVSQNDFADSKPFGSLISNTITGDAKG